jgi:hypothetical protein
MSFPTPALTLAAASVGKSTGPFNIPAGTIGAHIVINITALAGTAPTLTVTISGIDPVSGASYPIIASTALAATGTTVLRIFAGATPAANLTVSDILPPQIQITATIGGTTPAVTATIGGTIICNPVL